jgi:hypothetical protein
MVFRLRVLKDCKSSLRFLTLIFPFLLCYNVESIGQDLKQDPSIKNIIYQGETTLTKWKNKHHDHYVVTLKQGVKKSDLVRHNIEAVRVLGDNKVIVNDRNESMFMPADIFTEREPVNYLWKLSDYNSIDNSEAAVRVFTLRVTNAKQVSNHLSSVNGLKVINTSGNIILVECSLKCILEQVIVLDEVVYVGVESHIAAPESRVLDMNLNPNTVNKIHSFFPSLNGEGMTISIKEDKYNPADIDLTGRDVLSPVSADELSSHATDMATIAAGAGNSFVTGLGAAPSASITSSDFSNLTPDADEIFSSLHVSVQNHSYGTDIENFYGALAEAYDQNTNRNPSLLHVFSAGNEGLSASTGTYQGVTGFANLTGNFKMSKNTLSVGCVDTVGRPLPFSSRGPGYDGRIKPELVAYSTQGSSNAAALVSGISLLLQQAYKDANGTVPPSALIRAMLVNGAVDIDVPGPDFITGYGNPDSYRTLLNLIHENYFSGSIVQGQAINFTFDVVANIRNLKVTLAWNDPAATTNASKALVNDLDMVITDPLTTDYFPYILDSTPDETRLTLPATTGVDHTNNIEQIVIANPASGTHTIKVEGFDIPQAPQQFYIAFQADTTGLFEWDFPTAGDNMPYDGETNSYFQWKSTLPDATGKLEYSIDNGDTWLLIADNIDLKKGLFRWDAPRATAKALARMATGSGTYQTAAFTISRPLTVNVGFNCTDSVMFMWDRLDEAKHYRVLTLNNNYLQSFTTTTDTSIVLGKSVFPTPYVAIQPVLMDDTPVIRSLTYDYTLQSSGCFLVAFYNLPSNDDGIPLFVQLGTTYAVEQVVFERMQDNGFTEIGVIKPVNNTANTFIDREPIQGLNFYRARIILSNGQEVFSDTIETYFLTTKPFILFPNPVSQSEVLNIYFKDFKNQKVYFTLYHRDGKILKSILMETATEAVSLADVAPGLYLYVLATEEGRFRGKIVVR